MESVSMNDISRFMSLYLMNSTMNTGSLGNVGDSSSIGSSSSLGGSSNSILFEYMLKSLMENGQNSNQCNCSKNNIDYLSNNINNSSNTKTANTPAQTSSSSSETYGVYGDFYPMGKAPKLSGSDINISPRINDAIKSASLKYGVEESFIKAMIKQESSFNPNTTSRAGAKGLMQLMSYNCTEYGVKNPYNIEENVNGGVKYIKDLLDKFDGNKQLALSAYNGGITRMRNRGVDTVPEIVNMPKETRDYVSKVMGYYNQYKNIQVI